MYEKNLFDELGTGIEYWLSVIEAEESEEKHKKKSHTVTKSGTSSNNKRTNSYTSPSFKPDASTTSNKVNFHSNLSLKSLSTDKAPLTLSSISNISSGQALTIMGPPKLKDIIQERNQQKLISSKEEGGKWIIEDKTFQTERKRSLSVQGHREEEMPTSSVNILEFPDLLWCEDEWDETKEIRALERIKLQQKREVKPFFIQKYEKEAAAYWDKFYKRNTTNFYQDRHYLLQVFPELDTNTNGFSRISTNSSSTSSTISSIEGYDTTNLERNCLGECYNSTNFAEGEDKIFTKESSITRKSEEFIADSERLREDKEDNKSMYYAQDKTERYNENVTIMIELGCGVGNAVFPLLESSPNLFVYALDFSKTAIETFVKNDTRYLNRFRNRMEAFVHDATNPEWPDAVAKTGAHYVLCQFALSAIDPIHFSTIAKTLHKILMPGGRVLIRDYGRYDEAQLRFKPGCLLKDNFYVRQDGTRAYYFTTEDLRRMFCNEGFLEIENKYIRRQYANRKNTTARYRSWVHSKFEKPHE